MKCKTCGKEMKALLTSFYCDCEDKPQHSYTIYGDGYVSAYSTAVPMTSPPGESWTLACGECGSILYFVAQKIYEYNFTCPICNTRRTLIK